MKKAIKPEAGKHYINHVKDLIEIISIDGKNNSVKLRNHTENCTMIVRLNKLELKSEVIKKGANKVAKQLPYRGPRW